MASERKCDFLIVGQGLAGTCLAYQLISRNQKVLVIDKDGGAQCSRIAAGTFNPVATRIFSPTWMAEELVPFLNKFYNEVGIFLKSELIVHRPVLKILRSEGEKELWLKKSNNQFAADYLEKEILTGVSGLKSHCGIGRINNAGNVMMDILLGEFRKYLVGEKQLIEEEFNAESLDPASESGIQYRNISARKIIFCEGHRAAFNVFFGNLTFRITKGEALIISSPELQIQSIVHNRINIVPLGNGKFWVGSTFDWDDHSLQPTEIARQRIIEQLEDTITVNYEVIDHMVGIRPTTRDRRPFLGLHNSYPNLAIFNGMGTRGVMLAPFFSAQMAELLINEVPVDPAADIKRLSE